MPADNLAEIRHNPVYLAEFKHQRFVIERGRTSRIWILLALIMLIPALLFSLAQVVVGLIGPTSLQAQAVVSFGGGIGSVFIIVMNMAMYPVVTLITIGLAANSIQREKSGHTWDNLLLTNISSGQIITGKWWASLRALNGDVVMVMILRMGLVSLRCII